MEERLELPRQLAKRRKAGGQDSGHRSKRRSWAILERRFHALTWDFSNLSFSAGRPALEWSKSARPLSQTFGKKKAGRATVTLRGLPDDSGQSDRCGRVCPRSLTIHSGRLELRTLENNGTLETAQKIAAQESPHGVSGLRMTHRMLCQSGSGFRGSGMGLGGSPP
jgi:hypothetical protein